MEVAQSNQHRKKSNVKWTFFGNQFIKQQGKLSLSTQMLDEAYRRYPGLLTDTYSRILYMTTLSSGLRALVKSGHLKSVRYPGVREVLYGLPEWFDENGKVKSEYDIDISELI